MLKKLNLTKQFLTLGLNDRGSASLPQLLVAIALGGIVTAAAGAVFKNISDAAAYEKTIALWQQELIVWSQMLHGQCGNSDVAGILTLGASDFAATGKSKVAIKEFSTFVFRKHGATNIGLDVGFDSNRNVEIKKIALQQESRPLGANPGSILASVVIDVVFRQPGAEKIATDSTTEKIRQYSIPIILKVDTATKLSTGCGYDEEDSEMNCESRGGVYSYTRRECAGLDNLLRTL